MNSFSCYDRSGKINIRNRRYMNASDINDRFTDPYSIISSEYWQDNIDKMLIKDDTRRYEERLRQKPTLLKKIGKRIFISHRQADKQKALEIANFLDQHKIEYWIDVLDPDLDNSQNNAITIANIIEMALLNCSHVIALLTDNSKGSQWIPYEFGRVKEKRLMVDNAATYKYRLSNSLPEYMLLSPLFDSNQKMLGWINSGKSKSINFIM